MEHIIIIKHPEKPKNIEYKVSLPDKSEKYMKTIVVFVLRNIRLGATIDGLVRKEKYELPPEAIREILFLVCIRLSVVEMGLKSNTWIL